MNPSTKHPFFSVVIPLYNKENYIEDTLKSVLNQTFCDFEVIIVNDGSTDNSLEKVKSFSDTRIHIFEHKQNKGLSAARNTGIKEANTNYIAFIDADDLWKTHHLEQLHHLITSYPKKGLYCTGYTTQKSALIFHRAHFNDLPENFKGVIPDFFKHSLQNCVAWVSAICVPNRVFDAIGYFDSEIFSEQDTDLYIRIALKYDVVLDNSSASAIYNRTIKECLSNYFDKKDIPKLFYSYKNIEENHTTLKKYIDYNRFSSAIFFKLSSNITNSKKLIKDIDFKNLNSFQKLIIWLPKNVIQFLFYITNSLYLKSLFVYKPKKN